LAGAPRPWHAGPPVSRRTCVFHVLLVLGVLAPGQRAAAQPPHGAAPGYEATGEVAREAAGPSAIDPTATATVVDTRSRPRAGEELDEVLLEVPGAQSTSLGSLGAFKSLAIRGTDAQHTTVILGETPIDPVDGGAFDLSVIPPWLLDRVEVYRGGAPTWLGAGNLGGVLRLMPRRAQRTRGEVNVTGGSFGTYGARMSTEVSAGDLRFTGAVGARHTDGDFIFRSDPTPLTPGDETDARRTNAAMDEGNAFLRLETPLLGGTLELVGLGFERTGGVPGTQSQQTSATRRTVTRGLVLATFSAAGASLPTVSLPRWKFAATVGAGVEAREFTDTLNEIGLGARVADDRGQRLTARVAGEWNLGRNLGLTAVTSYRMDRFAPSDALAATAASSAAPSTRHTVGGALEARLSPNLGPTLFELRPSVRIDGAMTRLEEIRAEAPGGSVSSDVLVPTYRLAALLSPLGAATFTVSAARSTRVPSMVELFGDRGFLLGDARLRPEHSTTVDGGAVLRGDAGPVNANVEVRAFRTATTDLIRYVLTSQFQAVPENIGEAEFWGAELGAALGVTEHARFVGSATWLRARDLSTDRTVPLRPRFEGYGRAEFTGEPLGALERPIFYVDVTHVGSTFGDAANLVVISARTLIGVGLSSDLADGVLFATFSVRDLADRRGQDVLGFPLPGRTVFLSLTARTP
jgi:vitamin B12 transporter